MSLCHGCKMFVPLGGHDIVKTLQRTRQWKCWAQQVVFQVKDWKKCQPWTCPSWKARQDFTSRRNKEVTSVRLSQCKDWFILRVGSLDSSLSFPYENYCTNKEGKKKKNEAIAWQLILAKEKKYVYRTMFILWDGTTISDFKHEPFQPL